jgi:hypothetical protein
MLFDFTEAERNTARRALELYVSELKDEIGKTAYISIPPPPGMPP